jgi:hypothetical protein
VENPFLLLPLSVQHCTTPYFPYGIFSIPCPFYGFCVVLQKNRGGGGGWRSRQPQDPGTKKRNLGHPSRGCGWRGDGLECCGLLSVLRGRQLRLMDRLGAAVCVAKAGASSRTPRSRRWAAGMWRLRREERPKRGGSADGIAQVVRPKRKASGLKGLSYRGTPRRKTAGKNPREKPRGSLQKAADRRGLSLRYRLRKTVNANDALPTVGHPLLTYACSITYGRLGRCWGGRALPMGHCVALRVVQQSLLGLRLGGLWVQRSLFPRSSPGQETFLRSMVSNIVSGRGLGSCSRSKVPRGPKQRRGIWAVRVGESRRGPVRPKASSARGRTRKADRVRLGQRPLVGPR